MKSLCIVDTCSLIYLSDIKLANRSLHQWLWSEFEVRYSSAVRDEIERHKQKINSRDRQNRKWGKYVWKVRGISTCEQALFGKPYERYRIDECKRCRQPVIIKLPLYTPDLSSTDDRGERQNSCVALDAVIQDNKYNQVIFLTDDRRAIRNYVKPVFRIFPLGSIWTSLDFTLYLFMRHRKRIPLDALLNVMRDINAQHTNEESSKVIQRLTDYQKRAKEIEQTLKRI